MHNEDVVASAGPEEVAIRNQRLHILLQLLRLGDLDENGFLAHQQGDFLVLRKFLLLNLNIPNDRVIRLVRYRRVLVLLLNDGALILMVGLLPGVASLVQHVLYLDLTQLAVLLG